MNIEKIIENNGTLVPIEFKQLPFTPQRVFYVTNVPQYDIRGEHAHYECMQVVICISGKILVSLFDGFNTHHTMLMPGQSIFVDKLIWDQYQFMEEECVLLVICSNEYSKDDYINNKDEFINLIKEDREAKSGNFKK
jgi:dTDP-4-dehydrorhamnose 3,5-epimerase-like enzyme